MTVEKETKTPTDRPMNGWEALVKIAEDLAFTAVFLGILGVIYLLVK